MTRLRRYIPEFRACWRNRRGMATVELALISSFLVVLLLPLADIGMGFWIKTQVNTAAQAGAEYAFVHGWTSNNQATQSGIYNAVMNGSSLNASSTPTLISSSTPCDINSTPSCSTSSTAYIWLACKCANGVTGAVEDPTYNPSQPSSPFDQSRCSSQANCSGTNQNAVTPGAYVFVKAQATYTPLFNYIGLGSPMTFTAISAVRVQ